MGRNSSSETPSTAPGGNCPVHSVTPCPANAPINGMPVLHTPDGKTRVGNHIVIEGSPEFQQKVVNDLRKIGDTPSSDPSRAPAGQTTLNNINNGRHDVTIKETAGGNTTKLADVSDAQVPAKGTPSTIMYNDTPRPTAANPSVNRPGDVALQHELAHADSASRGNVSAAPSTIPGNPHAEEDQAINRDNQYRDDRGIPRRANHTVL